MKTGADLDRQKSFNFYLLKRAIENRLNLYKSINYLSIINPKEQGLY